MQRERREAFLLERKQYFSSLPDKRSYILKILQILWFTVTSQSTDANSVSWHVQIYSAAFEGKQTKCTSSNPLFDGFFFMSESATYPLVLSLCKSLAPASSLKVFKGNLQRLKIFPLTPPGFFSFLFPAKLTRAVKFVKLGQVWRSPPCRRVTGPQDHIWGW